MTHAWCSNPARDEAVRVAEDNRQGPLPTLEECISRAGQFVPSEPPQGAKCTERESVTNRRPVEPGGGGNVTGFAKPAKCSAAVSETGDAQSGIRTERVVLPAPVSRPAETRLSQQAKAQKIGGGWWFPKYDLPSLPPSPPPAPPQVHRGSGVFDANGDEVPWEGVVAALKDERDAAIRERDQAIQRADRDSVKCSALADNAIKLRTRVAELEAAPVAESATTPPPAPGWLTAEERAAVVYAAEQAPESDFVTNEEGRWIRETLTALLARSTPPEVVLEDFTRDAVRNLDAKYLAGWDQCMALAKRALAAAGVAVKEAGRE